MPESLCMLYKEPPVDNLLKMSLSQTKSKLLQGQCSAREVVDMFLARMESHTHLNTYITMTPELARQQAKQSDINFSQKKPRRLEGIPFAIKDLFCTRGLRTTAGSNILKNFVPPYESTVTQRLWDEGAICLGKTNMDEFAMGSANLTSAFGPVINPWKSKLNPTKNLVPGGSSGGSAAALAARLCLGALGSDTGGSIRQPAAFCGLVGIKPTYGLCSRFGMVAFASSLDQAGPMTHTVEDAARILEVMGGYDEKDAKSSRIAIPPYADFINTSLKGIKIGIPKEYIQNLHADTLGLLHQGMEWIRAAGAEIIEISLPLTACALPVYYIIAPAEASSNLARYDGIRYGERVEAPTVDELYERTRYEGFGPEVRRRILIGTYVLSAGYYDAYYLRAQKIRQLIRQNFQNTFSQVDLILTPTTPQAAFALDESPTDPVTMYLNDIFTVTVNLAGLPAISVPCGLNSEGLPLGLQLIAPHFQEQRLFNAGSVLEAASGFIQNYSL